MPVVATKTVDGRTVPAHLAARQRICAPVPMKDWIAQHHKPKPAPFWRRLFGRDEA